MDGHLSTALYPHLTSLRTALQISTFPYQASGRQTRYGLKAMMLWRSNKLIILEKDFPNYLASEWLSGLGEDLLRGANTSLVLEPDACARHSLSSSPCGMHTRAGPWDSLIQKTNSKGFMKNLFCTCWRRSRVSDFRASKWTSDCVETCFKTKLHRGKRGSKVWERMGSRHCACWTAAPAGCQRQLVFHGISSLIQRKGYNVCSIFWTWRDGGHSR